MKMFCLMPTYGRNKQMLMNSLACFTSQTYKDKILLINDDLGTLQNTVCKVPDVHIYSSNERASSVGAKYNSLISKAESLFGVHSTDAFVVWDDDDIYMETYLESHARVINGWSKPDEIITAYTNPASYESAIGRFHGTVAIQYNLLRKLGFWEDTRRGTFDQEFIAKLAAHSSPGIGGFWYVYRWQTSGGRHSSGMIHEDAYWNYKPESTVPINELWDEFDEDTIRIKAYIMQHLYPQRGWRV